MVCIGGRDGRTSLPFIDYEDLPAGHVLEYRRELLRVRDSFISGDKDVVLRSGRSTGRVGVEQFELLDYVARLRFPIEGDNTEFRGPALELTDPVCDG